MKLRLASADDAPSLLQIYAQYIDTPVTFECALPSVQEFAGRIRSVSGDYPYLVCEENGRIAGYAYAHRQKEREAYQWNAELSIYLDGSFTSRGLGAKLYLALFALLKLQGVHTVYGGVTLPNEKSERLHASLGFRRLGVYRNTGYKCRAWHDVAWFEKEIAPYDPEPALFLPFRAVPRDRWESILTTFSDAAGE